MTYEMLPEQIHGTLLAIAADGNAMQRAASDAGEAAEQVAGTCGSATDVAAAFTAFWSERDETAQRVGSLLFRKARAVAQAAEAFITADGEMNSSASAALASLPAGYAPDLPRGHGRFLE